MENPEIMSKLLTFLTWFFKMTEQALGSLDGIVG